MNDEVAEWTGFFNEVFSELRKRILKQYKPEEDGSGPPETLAIINVVSNFPCPVRVAEIRIDPEKHTQIKDEVCQIVRYDFSKLGVPSGIVEYYGVFEERDLERLRELLIEEFDLTFSFEEFKEFRTTGWYDDEMDFFVQFPLYNIKDSSSRLVEDFLWLVLNPLAARIRQELGKGIDWNSEFNLEPDPILPMSEITKMGKTLGAFLPFSQGAGIEELQKDICNIQLIPNVPEDVKRVFRHAKDLYIYGFFRYTFFTIAQHYSYLALESAIRNRYYRSFDKDVTLADETGETVRLAILDHQLVIDVCRSKGWNIHKLRINGEKFAYYASEVLNRLVQKGIITLWEKKQCQSGISLRNIMSHLTRASILTPGYSVQALEFVSDMINRLYSE